jgi:hypothetical protein
MMRTRRAGWWALGLTVLLGAAGAGAAARVVVEDWSRSQAGAQGIPPDWTGQNWGSPAYDFTVVENEGHKVLRLRSRDEGSTISKDVRGKVDLKAMPILEWRWKAVELPAGGHSCRAARDDQAAQLYVAWPRFPKALRSRIIGYVWDSTAPVGTVAKSEKTGTVTYVVVRSGTGDLNKWVTERRNVREDYKKIYGADPENPGGVSIAIDSNDTKSTAESYVGAILFKKP